MNDFACRLWNALREELTEMEGQIHAHFTKALTLKNIKHTSFGSGFSGKQLIIS